MATRITRLSASIAAGATVSLMQTDVEFGKVKSDVNPRLISKIGISGATVNTGELVGIIGNEEVFRMPNGVTNTTGAPITQFDATPILEEIGANENFDLQVRNTTGGALQFYVYVEIEDME